MAKRKNPARNEIRKEVFTPTVIQQALGEKAWRQVWFRHMGMNGTVPDGSKFCAYNKRKKYTNDEFLALPEDKRLEEAWAGMLQADKLKMMGEFVACVAALPEVRERFIEKAIEDPVTVMKLLVGMMPKDINVEVTQNQAVVILPTNASWKEWERRAKALNEGGGDIIDANAEDPWEGMRKAQDESA